MENNRKKRNVRDRILKSLNQNNTNVIDPEYSQIEVMVLAFKDGKQNWWCGYKKYKKYENK